MADRVIGTDVSFYQDDPQTPQGINFRQMRQAGAGFTIIRAGQNLWTDRDFKVNWREAKAAGIPRGSYWFYDSRIDPKQQAELWVSVFNGDFGELPLWADFEDNYNGQYKGWQHWYNFIERVKQLTPPKEIGVYTNYYYWLENTISKGIPAASLNYFKQYPLWVAAYNPTGPTVPQPWTAWTFWQFTDNGDGFPYGVESKNIDLNYFNGDLQAFRQRFALGDTPLPDLPPSNDYRVTASPSLRVREAPDANAKQIGSVLFNETVEKIGENPDKTWLNIKRKDGSLTGWSFAAYLQRLSASPSPTPDPKPTPDPTPEPTPTNKWYRVTTASLRVREGAGTNFTQIGSILLNEVVQELDANADRSWLKIRKADGTLTGWSSSEFLQATTAPDTPPPPPEQEDKDWYRVTAAPSLKVRLGPGTEHESIGLVYFGELVEKIDSTLDGAWFKVRNQTGTLIGWCSSQYLISASSSTPTPPPPPTTIPDYKDKNWYRVNTATLNVREAPNQTSKIVGTVSKNDTVPGLDDSSNPEWVRIQKLDGLIGWCSKSLLVQIGTTRPASVTQIINTGITYLRKDLTTPRPVVVHVMAIDLQTTKLEFLVTPPSKNGGDVICTRTTSQFLDEFKLHVAINGGYFSYLDSSFDPKKLCPNGGEPVRVGDFVASRGNIYSKKKTAQPVVYIGKKNQVSFNKVSGAVFNAVSGDRLVVVDGKVVKNLAALAPAPRTAIGLSKNNRWLTWMVIDGRQDGYSEGVTLSELGELLLSYGVHTGANMDGGGSSAMVIRGFDGKSRTVNSPIDFGQPGRQRRVATHLGLLVKP